MSEEKIQNVNVTEKPTVIVAEARDNISGEYRDNNKSEHRQVYNEKRGVMPKQNNVTKFQGREDELKGHVFDVLRGINADPYSKTLEEIRTFVQKNFDYGGDIVACLKKMERVEPPEPEDVPKGASAVRKKILDRKIEHYVKRLEKLDENIQKLYGLVWGQCSDAMREKIEAHDNFANVDDEQDGIGLLKIVKSICYNFQSGKVFPADALLVALRRFYNGFQHDMPTDAYVKQFKNSIEVVTEGGGMIGAGPGLASWLASDAGEDFSALDPNEKKAYIDLAQEMFHATTMIFNADKRRYSGLILGLRNSYAQGHDKWPRTMEAAHSLLTTWKQEIKHNDANNGGVRASVKHMTTTTGGAHALVTAGDDGKVFADTKCYKCNKMGHYADHCPDKKNEQTETEQEPEPGTKKTLTGTQLLMHACESGELPDYTLIPDYALSQHHEITGVNDSTENPGVHNHIKNPGVPKIKF